MGPANVLAGGWNPAPVLGSGSSTPPRAPTLSDLSWPPSQDPADLIPYLVRWLNAPPAAPPRPSGASLASIFNPLLSSGGVLGATAPGLSQAPYLATDWNPPFSSGLPSSAPPNAPSLSDAQWRSSPSTADLLDIPASRPNASAASPPNSPPRPSLSELRDPSSYGAIPGSITSDPALAAYPGAGRFPQAGGSGLASYDASAPSQRRLSAAELLQPPESGPTPDYSSLVDPVSTRAGAPSQYSHDAYSNVPPDLSGAANSTTTELPPPLNYGSATNTALFDDSAAPSLVERLRQYYLDTDDPSQNKNASNNIILAAGIEDPFKKLQRKAARELKPSWSQDWEDEALEDGIVHLDPWGFGDNPAPMPPSQQGGLQGGSPAGSNPIVAAGRKAAELGNAALDAARARDAAADGNDRQSAWDADNVPDGSNPEISSPPVQFAPDGSFSVVDWSNYPTYLPQPTGPFRLLSDSEYWAARSAADKANRALRSANPLAYKDMDIHEIHPFKFGGSPTDPANKIVLPRHDHRRVTAWWRQLQLSIEKANGK
jgi:hypothetical protein